MRIALRHDVALPAAEAFAAATDFDQLERVALSRGIRATRTNRLHSTGQGMAWDLGFKFRGRDRRVGTTLVTYDPPQQAVFEGASDHLEIGLVFSVIALSRDRSRLSVEIDLRPRTLRARVMIQSARLARGRIERTLRARFESFVEKLAPRAR